MTLTALVAKLPLTLDELLDGLVRIGHESLLDGADRVEPVAFSVPGGPDRLGARHQAACSASENSPDQFASFRNRICTAWSSGCSTDATCRAIDCMTSRQSAPSGNAWYSRLKMSASASSC